MVDHTTAHPICDKHPGSAQLQLVQSSACYCSSPAILDGVKVQDCVCRDVTLKAHEVWAGWVAQGLRMELQAALQSDAALKSSTPLQAWEETIIAQVASCPSQLVCGVGVRGSASLPPGLYMGVKGILEGSWLPLFLRDGLWMVTYAGSHKGMHK